MTADDKMNKIEELIDQFDNEEIESDFDLVEKIREITKSVCALNQEPEGSGSSI